MTGGDLLTRATIWVAIAAYLVAACAFAASRGRRTWDAAARLTWTIACAALVAHAAAAFHFFHGWSHAAAYRDTARQTAAVVGRGWGGGVYVNYALLVAWVLDVAWWWWRGLDAYRRRPRWLTATWQAFVLFILFNGTVVFGTGPVRWLGGAVCLAVVLAWWLGSRRPTAPAG